MNGLSGSLRAPRSADGGGTGSASAALGWVMVAPCGQELSYEAWKGPHQERSQAPVLSPRSRATPPGKVLRSVINGSPRRPPLLGSPLMDPYGSQGSAPGRLCAPPLDALRSGSVSPTVAMHKPRDWKAILTGGPKRAGSPWDRIRSRNPNHLVPTSQTIL